MSPQTAIFSKTIHISDETGRFALIEDNGTNVLTRYQHTNHLGSSSLETDSAGVVISYEEYHPFGTTAYQATLNTLGSSAKRYRFCGKEKDEESGLYYYGARYYACWLGRWMSVDPKESERHWVNGYNYCQNNPVNIEDPSGALDDGEDKKVKMPAHKAGSDAMSTGIASVAEPKIDKSLVRSGYWANLDKGTLFEQTMTVDAANKEGLIATLPPVDVIAKAPPKESSMLEGKGPLAYFGYKDPSWAKEGNADGAYGAGIGMKDWRAAGEALNSFGSKTQILGFSLLLSPAAPVGLSLIVAGEYLGDIGTVGLIITDHKLKEHHEANVYTVGLLANRAMDILIKKSPLLKSIDTIDKGVSIVIDMTIDIYNDYIRKKNYGRKK